MKNSLTQFAQKIDAAANGIPTGGGDDLLKNALNLTYFLAGAIAVIVIVVAGIAYVVSSGDAGRVAKAKNLLTYAVIGLVVVVSAFGITNFVIGSFN
jgi:type IV secretory pathway VirB2 component (pilin)